jgi:hypothetical protein
LSKLTELYRVSATFAPAHSHEAKQPYGEQWYAACEHTRYVDKETARTTVMVALWDKIETRDGR